MSLPVVVIVGRPNVGKSSLLNQFARQRISIVDPRAGITRDRVSVPIEYNDRYFEIVDTGGIGIVDDDHLETHVEEQIEIAIARADVVIFLVDVNDGVTSLDQRIATRLRPLRDRVILAVNKVDDKKHEALAAEFHALGFGEPLCCSALHGHGRFELLDQVFALIGDEAPEIALPDPVMKLAIVGKRNAGKSSFVNALAGEERMIVSEIPGTTRDAVDVRFEKEGRAFIAIDTAGVRKKQSMDDIDFYSYTRALRSIRRADVVLFLIDAEVPIAEVDLKLAAAILEEFKPVVLGINKWDLVKGRATSDEFGTYLSGVMPMLGFAPIVFVTAIEQKNIDAAIDVALMLRKQATTRVTTGRLNAALQDILALRGPSPKHGTKAVKIYYGTQVGVSPPTIVFFCNDADLVTEDYRRFMTNRLREILPFKEIPFRLWFKTRSRDSEPHA